MDAKILQKLKEIDREFKSMERFRLSMVKSRKKRIMKRIKKGEPADYKGYKKELTARVKTHLSRVNKSIKAYSKMLKKKSRKPRKKKSVKKKSKRKKMKMCGCGIDVHFRMKKIGKGKKKEDIPRKKMNKFLRQIVDALRICGIPDKKIYHNHGHKLLSQVIAGQPFAKKKIFHRKKNGMSVFEFIEDGREGKNREEAIFFFYNPWLRTYAEHVEEQARIHKEKQDAEFLRSQEFSGLSVEEASSDDIAGEIGNLSIE